MKGAYEFMTVKLLPVERVFKLLRSGWIIHPTVSAVGLAENRTRGIVSAPKENAVTLF